LESALPDVELRDWMQRAIGYTLTGSTIEEILLFVHGPTRSGKSTFLEAIKAMFGDYARNADFETFLDRGKDGTARSDIARLAGARLVTSNEIDEGRKLAEGLVKTLTGGDTITARFLYRDEFEYAPQFKLLLAANHKPRAKGNDDALWRRIRLLPFVHPPSKVDSGLKTYLSTDPNARSAILAWAVVGCQQWRDRGLRTVAAVREATQAYRAEQDPLSEFFADHCVFDNTDANCWVLASDLRSAYEEWAKEQGIRRTLSPSHFKELIEDRGCIGDRKRIEGKTRRLWRGVRLLALNEEPQLPGIHVAPVAVDEKTEQVPENDVAPVADETERDARDEQNPGSQESPYVRAHEEDFSETPEHPARASRGGVTGVTPLLDTSSEVSPGDGNRPVAGDGQASFEIEYADGFVGCANCGTPVRPATRPDGRVFKTYCDSCEPF
jgi:P4 family phage/plasmid primase-like protien